ncbi:stage V sporulation protein AE [Bacillus carboniphilus]|uniref:Stage V sporulation protein AE n=1 Tax=Bacillus carboniphilus TaxID=86663 RepID=A0ABY9JZ69_9BACI|nr:stage V sporulation protein AE [Bacillus carboniphilus]WLR43798.1 stage V sporulation protein AE [Bacillus carboniphilus]
MNTRSVILVTDGDEYALKAIEYVAGKIGGRCISRSQGNPSVLTGEELVYYIHQTPHDPIFVLFDDCGLKGEGSGEKALKYVANHKTIVVLGVIVVASKSRGKEWTKVDVCIDKHGQLTSYGVDKEGIPDIEKQRITGDTVYCLDEIVAPVKVGIGDIGKMGGKDDVKKGSPITMKAVELILERSQYRDRQSRKK